MKLAGHGIQAVLPQGWEGAIVTGSPIDLRRSHMYSLRKPPGADEATPPPGADEATTTVAAPPVVHLANFALPPNRGDFGSGAVEVMQATDIFVSLLEYGPENVGTGLFTEAQPGALPERDFDATALQRILPGQVGHQSFFSTHDRAFCLYVVLGGAGHTGGFADLVMVANKAIAGITIGGGR